MTDEELIEGLRKNAMWVTTHDAADRIEQLVKKNDNLLDLALTEHTRAESSAYKLAKAVEALCEIYGDGNATGCNPQWMSNTAGKVLAELEKDT